MYVIAGMTDSVQNDILYRFRVGFFKILVCPVSGIEDFDVPDCNIVISYSADEIAKVQMKGKFF